LSRQALIVFGKNPVPGLVKTRLARSIGDSAAAALYRAFLLDALESYAALSADVRLYLAPSSEPVIDALGVWAGRTFTQNGAGLGDKMVQAFADTFALGYDQVVITGTDHPTLPISTVQKAFDVLEGPETVSIGPSDDGGYYLMGLTRARRSLFEGIQYSRSDVLKNTLNLARIEGMQVVVLEPWYDVDTKADLDRLEADLEEGGGPCPRTSEVLGM